MAIVLGFLRQYFRPGWWAYNLLGPASRDDYFAPIVHLHDDYEQASDMDLAGFEVETDTHAYRYAVRLNGGFLAAPQMGDLIRTDSPSPPTSPS